MSRYTKEDIFRIVEEEDVEFIRLQFTDIFGTLKNVAITSSQLEKALNNKCMFDGSSIEGFVRIEESVPGAASFWCMPWMWKENPVELKNPWHSFWETGEKFRSPMPEAFTVLKIWKKFHSLEETG